MLPPYSPRTIAQWYHSTEATPTAETRRAYAALNEQCALQLLIMVRGIGLHVSWQVDNPYAASAALFEDVSARGQLRVLKSTEAPHALMTARENDIFRAVHDYFGHYRGRNGFGPVGEYKAFLRHATDFTGPNAIHAMATETLGQNSWVNFGPFSHLPAAERPYADQKPLYFPSALLPKGL